MENQVRISGKVVMFPEGISVEAPFTLNDQQLELMNKLLVFLKSDNSTFALMGYAGTGKTSLMQIFEQYINKSRAKRILFSSPTHRANSVLKSKVSGDVVTIHSLLGIQPNIDATEFDAKSVKFVKKGKASMPFSAILVVDESSMVSNSLGRLIKGTAKERGTQVIFLGDTAQLPPVKQNSTSRTLTNSDDSYILTKVERTGDNALLNDLTLLRSGGKLSKKTSLNKDGEGIVYEHDMGKVVEESANIIKSDVFLNDPLAIRLLSYTNKGAENINTKIRKYLFGRNPDEYYVGDVLMGYDNIKGKVVNSMDYSVTKILPSTHAVCGIEMDIFFLTTQNIMNSAERPVRLVMLSEFNPSDKMIELGDKISEFINAAKRAVYGTKEYKRLWQRYYACIESFVSPCDIVNSEGRVMKVASLKYGYAHTIHKSQGGTYTNVVVDADTFGMADGDTVRKLMYVGLSRASKKATIISNQMSFNN